jgi:SAM-dependent methyltransferase
MTRNEKILSGLSRDMKFLEIGPSFNPIVPKRDGWKAWTVDHATQEELVAKYAGHPGVDTARIEHVDFVWTDGHLCAAIPTAMHGSFDACIASHVIEHIPDLVGFLNSLATMLRPGGVVALAIPDKRFCFDYFRPPSTTGQVIEASLQDDRNRHRRAALFDHFAYQCSMNGTHAWGQHPIGEPVLPHSLHEAWQISATPPADEYVDCHAWQFTPTSFELIIFELAALGLVDCHAVRSFPSEGCEFFVQLQRGKGDASTGKEGNPKRLAMVTRVLEELREQIDYLSAR